MIRICMKCKKLLGFKKPWLDMSVTHGCCKKCLKEYDKMLAKMDAKK